MKDAANGTLSTESENATPGRVVMRQPRHENAVRQCLSQYTAEELLITACVSLMERYEQGPLMKVRPQVRLGMTIKNAAQPADALQTALARYRSQFSFSGRDNVRLGLNYNLEAGAHCTRHGLFATFRYEF